jgi:hypothetical protein
MPRLTWGSAVQQRSRNFLKAILEYAAKQEYADKPDNRFDGKWKDEELDQPKLIVTSKRQKLQDISGLKDYQFYEVIKILEALGILDDRRRKRQGAEEWYFALKLWSKDPLKNLNQLDIIWENKRPKAAPKIGKSLEALLSESNIQNVEMTYSIGCGYSLRKIPHQNKYAED